ncbi:MAG: glycosyltransferase family 4 protein [Flavobacteriaceae bacterium]|nr:glycosyltransferase family 4 protein [Flavobacteriaceae bacterium]
MHIAFLTPEYPHKKIANCAGLGTSIKNLASELIKLHYKVSVFIYSQDTSEIVDDNGIIIHKIAYKKHSFLSWYFYRKDIQKYINKVIQKEKIDLVEAADWTGITAFMKFDCPILIRLHSSDAYFCNLEGRKQHFKNFFFEKKALKSASYITSVSKFTADKTKEIFNLKQEIKIIHNGIDIQHFSEIDTETLPSSILYFGSIIRKKGVLELASIFNLIIKKSPNTILNLLGKDVIDIFKKKSTLQLFKEKLSEKALKKINHINHVPYQEVKNYITKASVVVLPSFAEAFPMTWLEAMALKKALVTSDIGWAKELMIDGETGYTVNPKNHQEYADKVLQLLNDQVLNSKMGNGARNRIEDSFLQKNIAKQNINYYKSIINEKI